MNIAFTQKTFIR